jgi:hypothetical protein
VLGFQGTTGVGVMGLSLNGTGVNGISMTNATGVKGVSNTGASSTDDGSGSGFGVHGKSNSGSGVKGEAASGNGVLGQSTSGAGLRGVSASFVGIVGISTSSHGLYGSSNAGAGSFGIVAENLGANGPGLLVTGTTPSQVFGGLQVFGAKNAVLKMQDGSFASVYCQESPEPYFEDFGKAQVVGGVASVALEREFASLVAGGEYHVFTEAEGDTRGLFVSRKGPGGFEVREVQGGTGNVAFSYRIVTRRKDIEGRRFARVSVEAAQKVAGVRAALAAMPAAGAASPSAPVPTQVVTVGPGATVERPGAGR